MKRVAIALGGTVQGVGLRPRVAREATTRGLSGFVRNAPFGVEIEVEGAPTDVDHFATTFLAREGHVLEAKEIEETGRAGFSIEASSEGGRARAALPPDLAPCVRCAAEIRSEGRRRGYPFTSCTACGPRASIATGLPWDRARTSMSSFAMCASCLAEYEDLTDRRAHAQTIACPACGPRLAYDERAHGAAAFSSEGEVVGDDALARAIASLERGSIVAVKGVGGYQLLVDATNERAVRALRERKGRVAKPFAVLFATAEAAAREANVSDDERALLESPAAPIVLLRARDVATLAPSVAPSSRLVGALLPASPLHALLARGVSRPLVCTSGNPSDEPLVVRDDEASARLAPLADAILRHDRRVERPLDDSVARMTRSGPVLLRRARGYAPRPLARPEPGPVVLALGAHMKATCALALRDEIWVSPHVGDLGSPRALDRLAASAREMLSWANARPDVVACDAHPDLPGTRLAESLARELGAELVRVPHHAAHVAAIAVEHGVLGALFGLAWDGMGYGDDGSIWGGEALLLDGPIATRVAHLRAFRLPGGDAAMREPRRAALGVSMEAGLPLDALAAWFSPPEIEILSRAAQRGVNAPWTTSAGRLFDAVAALSGLCGISRFEAEAAIALEQATPRAPLPPPVALPISDDACATIDWSPVVRAIVEGRAASPGAASALLLASLARAARELAARRAFGVCALAGGCFQNALLVDAIRDELEASGVRVLAARELPPNDGAISVGQTLLASRLASRRSGSSSAGARPTRETA